MPPQILFNIRKSYRRKIVLEDVSHSFQIGLTLLVGPSGAGKSTLLRLIATAETANGGRIEWNGAALPGAQRAAACQYRQHYRQIAMHPQYPRVSIQSSVSPGLYVLPGVRPDLVLRSKPITSAPPSIGTPKEEMAQPIIT